MEKGDLKITGQLLLFNFFGMCWEWMEFGEPQTNQGIGYIDLLTVAKVTQSSILRHECQGQGAERWVK